MVGWSRVIDADLGVEVEYGEVLFRGRDHRCGVWRH